MQVLKLNFGTYSYSTSWQQVPIVPLWLNDKHWWYTKTSPTQITYPIIPNSHGGLYQKPLQLQLQFWRQPPLVRLHKRSSSYFLQQGYWPPEWKQIAELGWCWAREALGHRGPPLHCTASFDAVLHSLQSELIKTQSKWTNIISMLTIYFSCVDNVNGNMTSNWMFCLVKSRQSKWISIISMTTRGGCVF